MILRLGAAVPKARAREALRAAAARHSLSPDYVDAIGKVETGWASNLVNQTGPDAKRGGAWGLTQITERTARAHGYTGPMEALVADVELAAEWTGRILAEANEAKRMETLADYCAAWNAGRYDADKDNDGDLDELPAGHSTREHYLPRAIQALAFVRANPVHTPKLA
jgi:soluble lytic murein transglycosylase-like protein